MKNANHLRKAFSVIMFIGLMTLSFFGTGATPNAHAQGVGPVAPVTSISDSPYFPSQTIRLKDGARLEKSIINNSLKPPEGYELARKAVTLPQPNRAMGTNVLTVPVYSVFFGGSATASAMIAAYYDRNGLSNMYTGPTNGGVMPLNDSSWGGECPLTASHQGLDGRTTRGSIDDYWVDWGSTDPDPYITGDWTQHTWGDAIGDYMKTSQSAYGNNDGSTTFYNWISDPSPLTCDDMVSYEIDQYDGTYGRKLFYEARGYTVTDCYNQKTDNNGGDFTFAMYKAEIDAGRPVLLSLQGHSIVGVGYDDSTNTVYLHDLWDNLTHSMTWGGSYSGLPLYSVSIVNLSTPDNPVPTLATLNPSAKIAGEAAFTLTVNGTNFITSSVVRWNGNARTTTYVSATQLTAAITAADIASQGSYPVTVFNPAPGGGISNAVNFTVNPVTPPANVILAITPASKSVTVGQDFSLAVEVRAGTQSVDGAAAYLNLNPAYLQVVSITPGSTLSNVLQNSYNNTLGQVNFAAGTLSSFPSGTFTLATIAFHAVAPVDNTPISFNATVPRKSDVTYGGGSVLSSTISATVTITNPVNNPVPTLSTLNPSSKTAGEAAFILTVNGTNFITSSVVRWNASARTTTYISATQLTAAITATDIATAGSFPITVFNPAPGGGTSNSVNFTVNPVTPPGNVTLAITPASNSVTVGQNFSLVIEVRAGTQSVDGAAAYLNFNPAYLQVVSVTPGSTLSSVLQNSYDNTLGQVNFAAGTLSSFPSGTFTLATVTFHAIAPVNNSPVSFNATLPRKSDVTFSGGSVLGPTLGATVTITAQGVTLAITPASSSVSAGQNFSLVVEVRAGAQSVDGAAAYLNFDPAYLQVVSITPGSTLSSVLQNSYDNTLGQVNYAAGILSSFPSGTFTLATITFHAQAAIDNTLVSFNATIPRKSDVTFGGASILGPTLGATVTITPQGVTLALTPASNSVTVGQNFSLVIEVRAGTHSVDGAAAYLNFNPAYLQVMSITPGSTLPNILQNSYDNTLGQVSFAAGTLSSFPSGTFTLATITFHSVALVAKTPVSFNATLPRKSDVTYGGGSVLGSTIGATLRIGNYFVFLPFTRK